MHPVLGLFRRNDWATRELLRFCAGLPPEVLERADPDVYGSIAAGFKHIVGAEMRYLSRLDGVPPGLDEEAPLALSDLEEPARACAQRWEALLRSDFDPERRREHQRSGTRFRIADWLGFVQAVHHGDDHRTQINTLLSRQGITPPDLDGWHFGERADDTGDTSPAAGALLNHFFGHHVWANDRLLRWYVGLPDGAREASAEGTYGSITDTLTHLVMSDRTYLARLQAHDWPGDLGDFERGIERRGTAVPAWVIVVQAIHHGNDHRTHAGTVSLANDLGAPDVDVWAYALEVGAYSED